MTITATRRSALASTIETPALIPAGRTAPRNYRANTYPFRASSHFLYFVGKAIEGAYLLIEPDGRARLFLPEKPDDDALWHGATSSAEEQAHALGLEAAKLSELEAELRTLSSTYDGIATIAAPRTSTRNEQSALLARTLERKAFDAALEEAVIALRLTHDEAAIRGLHEAADVTIAAHLAGMANTAPGVTEYEVRAAMEFAMASRDCVPAYLPIVSVHGEVLHNHYHGNICQDGDLLLCDVGAENPGGWAGDVTRTWPVNGTFSGTQRAIYNIVLASQEACIDMVAPGVRYRDVHLCAAKVITQGLVDEGILEGSVDNLVERGVHALFFPHGVGHLIGLDVHDMEDLGDRAGYASGRARSEQFGLSYLRLDRDLEAGMAVTIEPGFYQVPAILQDETRFSELKSAINWETLERFSDVRGIRIEDDVLVTEDGNTVLTADLARDPDSIEALVR